MRFAFSVLLASALLYAGGCRRPTPNEPVAPDPGANTKPSDVPNPGEKPKQSENDKAELQRLKGTWTVTAVVAAGKLVPADRVQRMQLQYIFDGSKVTVHRPDRADDARTFTVDTSVAPNRLTIAGDPGTRAVYSIEGDKLRLCVMVEENPKAGYPSELVSKPSPKTDLLSLERRAAVAQGPAATPPGGTVYVYSQSTGKLMLNDRPVCVGYSGKGAAKNDPAKQADKDGPIPIGEYLLTGFRDDPKFGGKIIGLLPVAGTNFFKRFPGETFAIIPDAGNPPSGCFIVVGRDVLDKLSTFNTKLRVVK